jgi:hypothetical protein
LNKNESKNKYIEITKNENRIAEKEAQLRSVKGHGYSPEKRFLEAAEILEKEGSSSPRYLWRKAVLKAEIKYGKYLNKIQDNTESGYSELIEALKKIMITNARRCIFPLTIAHEYKNLLDIQVMTNLLIYLTPQKIIFVQ